MVQDPNAQFTSRRRNLAVAIGLGVALLGVGMLLLFTHGGSGTSTCVQQSFVVASQPIPKGTSFTATTIQADIKQASLCQDAVPPTALRSANDLLAKYSVIDIAQNQTITASMLAVAPNAGTAPPPPPFTVHKGWVAIAIPDDQQTGVAGFISPDDHIDILVDTITAFRFAFQDVHVLYVGSAGQQTSGGAGMLVVELPRAQAEELSFFISGKFKTPSGAVAPNQPAIVKYALRPKDERGYEPAGDYNPVNSDLNPGHQAVNDPGFNGDVFNQVFGT